MFLFVGVTPTISFRNVFIYAISMYFLKSSAFSLFIFISPKLKQWVGNWETLRTNFVLYLVGYNRYIEGIG